MTTRTRVFSRLGYQMAELDGTFDRAWLLNDVGEMEFTLSIRDRKARQEFLEFGTYILAEHDKLPAWVGVIDPPLEWSGDQAITVSAYAAETVFSWRNSEDKEVLKGTPGEMFKRIIRLCNLPEDLWIREGSIFTGGKEREETLEESDLLSDIRRIAERSGNDFSIDPVFDDQRRLTLSANWHYVRGMYRSDMVLQEGINLELPTGSLMTEQGTIVNRIVALGGGATANAKLKHTETDEESRLRYRLRVGSKQFDSTDLATLKANAREALDTEAYPERVFPFYLLDVGNAFSLRIGDIVPVHLYSGGFRRSGGFGVQTYVRIVGMRLQEDDGRLELYGKEVRL